MDITPVSPRTPVKKGPQTRKEGADAYRLDLSDLEVSNSLINPSLVTASADDGLLARFGQTGFSQLGNQGITRAEFISVAGIASVAVFGASGIITKLLSDRFDAKIDKLKLQSGPAGQTGQPGPRGPAGADGSDGTSPSGSSGTTSSGGSSTSGVSQSEFEAHTSAGTNVHGIADTSALATDSDVSSAVATHSADTTSVHGISNTSSLAYTNADNNFSVAQTFASTITASNYQRGTGTPEGLVTGSVGDLFLRTDGGTNTTLYVKETGNSTNTGWSPVVDSSTAIATHEADTTNVHGIADTSVVMLEGDAAGGVLSGTYPNPGFAADMATQAELDAHAADTTAVHGIADTSALATTADIATHNADTTSVHGIADTSALLTSLNLAVRSESSAYTATASDAVILCNATTAAFTVTLPTAVGNTGKVFYIKKTDASANAVTIDGSGVQTIDGAATAAITVQYASVTIVSDNANWHII